MTSPVALVTGGTAGIGRSVADKLRRDGFTVAICARRRDRLVALEKDGFVVFECDVSSRKSISDMMSSIAETLGRLDVLVNSAGVGTVRGDFLDISEAEIRRLFEVNVFGTFAVTQGALPLLRVNGGTIVNLSSTLSQRPRPGTTVYAATKGAVEAFSRGLATEEAKNLIRIHVVAPALVRSEIWTATGMSEDEYQKLLDSRAREFPLGRAGEPEDVSELIAYLASPRAQWMTGTLIPVDGGAVLR